MSHHDNDLIGDQPDPLDKMLNQWDAPGAPVRLEAAVLKAYRREITPYGWRWLLRGNLRVPVPVAFGGLAAACFLFAFLAFHRRVSPISTQPKVIVETRTVEVPVIQDRVRVVYRNRVPHPAATSTHSTPVTVVDRPVQEDHGFQFVTALTPQIVRRDHVD